MTTPSTLPLPHWAKPVAEPQLKDLLNQVKKEVMLQFNCHAIATVTNYDSTQNTVEAKMAYTKTFYEKQENGVYNPIAVEYPVLLDCPVITLHGGDSGLMFPIAPGDDCLILFNDRQIDNWFIGQYGAQVSIPRLHSFSDGLALVGLFGKQKFPAAAFDPDRVKLYNGSTYVGVSSTHVKVDNGTTTLKELLDSTNGILKVLQDLATAITPTTGLSAGGLATITAEITALNVTIGGLLE